MESRVWVREPVDDMNECQIRESVEDRARELKKDGSEIY